MEPKILMFDIETAPNMGYIWGLWNKIYNMEMIDHEWYILCWCAKWYQNDEIFSSALVDYPEQYKLNPRNDLEVMKDLHAALDEADIVVAHNAIKFDIRKVNTRFVAHGIKPPSPYQVVDTLKIARRHFSFTSNKLDDLGRLLNLGRKEKTEGFKLWTDCMDGNLDAWEKMIKYCAQDVKLLEQVYTTLIPYAAGTPNISVITNQFSCPKCGSTNVQRRGTAYTNSLAYQRWCCMDCGSWSRSRKKMSEEDGGTGLTLTSIS